MIIIKPLICTVFSMFNAVLPRVDYFQDIYYRNQAGFTLGSRGFFFLSIMKPLTRLRREPAVSIRKKYPLEPRVGWILFPSTINIFKDDENLLPDVTSYTGQV